MIQFQTGLDRGKHVDVSAMGQNEKRIVGLIPLLKKVKPLASEEFT